MEIVAFFLWVIVGWILIASAAYYGALQALQTFFGDHADRESRSAPRR